MWNDQKRQITSELSPGETLIWSGRPKQGLVFRASDLYFVFMLGFMAFWLFMVYKMNPPFPFMLVAVPGILLAVYMNTLRYFVNSKQRAKTYYGVTSERAIIVSGLRGRQIKSLHLKFMEDISLDERADGTGTIKFGPAEPDSSIWAKYFSRENSPVYPSFDLIPEAKKVYEMVRSAQKNSRS